MKKEKKIEKRLCPICKGKGGFEYEEITFWSPEEPQVKATTFRQCRECDGQGYIYDQPPTKKTK